MPALRTDYLLADNGHARWVRRLGAAHDFVTIEEMHAQRAAPAHPQGVFFESAGGRFNVEARRAATTNRRYRFAKAVAAAINAKVTRGDLKRLCLVAPAQTLAAIRRQLSPETSARIAHVLAKDLTKTPDHSLGDWLHSLELN